MQKKSLINLENKIKQAAQNYYTGTECITDEQFDSMVDKLKAADPQNKLINQVGWGLEVDKVNGVKVEHKYGVVGSLLKIHHTDEIPTYMDKLVGSTKLDGASCVAYFINGKLDKAVSRGNGYVGVVRTSQFLKIINKYNLIMGNFTGGIRGEIVISNENWNKYLEKYPDAKLPRNVATGLFMRDDVSEDLQFVDFCTYKITGCENQLFTSYLDILNTLVKFGFPVVEYEVFSRKQASDEYMQQIFSKWTKYPMDGIVLNSQITQEINNIVYSDIAYKFQAEIKETQVTNVEWNLSKNNIMVPIVHIEPVELSGAIVSKTSGFNYKYIVDNKVGTGAKVKMCRSGEVVPYLLEVTCPAVQPDVIGVCPVCGEPLVEDGVDLICANEQCSNVEDARLINWIQVVGVRNLLGVGPALLNELIQKIKRIYNRNTVTIIDLYDKTGILDDTKRKYLLTQFTPAAADKVSQILINLKAPISISLALCGLNIYGLGKTICERIALNVYNWYTSQDIHFINDICTIDGLGDSVKNSVLNRLKLINDVFYCANIECKNLTANLTPSMQITVTGALSIPRKQFEAMCADKNIAVSDNIKSSKYLLTNDTTTGSSKLQKAKKYGIEILSEQQFMKRFL